MRTDYTILREIVDACMDTKYSLPQDFDCSVFNGCYITGDIDDAYLARLEEARRDNKASRKTPMEEVTNNN